MVRKSLEVLLSNSSCAFVDIAGFEHVCLSVFVQLAPQKHIFDFVIFVSSFIRLLTDQGTYS